ncbi:HAMP domain-containing histidine kinase [Waterburya agarophytonicola K14]|uniref:histidine kinase n=1 Tax=Waterburya agarophytonicola KI4 TaxID=2874699 RepID=A0A964BQC9_9CYAN|nr:PAS domain-containing sensor histidine kinase [Waterburya agarophytonicola]MCC0177465.1 HAMP domain-containing histidine kinase [Waterburya agarophytonicola KI4]
MAAINFFLGLTVGIGIYVGQQYRFKQQLKSTLKSYGTGEDEEISLPLHSLIRRELIDLNRQRRKLEKDKQAWQELIEQAPIGYLQVDGENQLLGCNQAAKDLLKIDSRRSQRVRLLLELVRSYDLDSLIEETRRSLRPQQKEWIFYFTRYAYPEDKESETNAYKSSRRIVESIALKGYGFPLSNRQVGVFIENRQPLVELSQSRDRTFSDLTHELRTPLTSISLVAENLQRRLQDPEKRWVTQMLGETNRLIELVQEWLDLTQLEAAPERTLKYEEIKIYDLIESVWLTLEPIANRKKVTLSYSGDRSIILEGDRSRLTQVFLNLLDNAIKHNPPQKEIFVQTSSIESEDISLPEKIKVDVIDSGRGFTANDLPYIFERLYRGDKSRTREQEDRNYSLDGSGLGLAIVEQIVRAHEGAIAANNHPTMGGAWVEVILPVKKSEKN